MISSNIKVVSSVFIIFLVYVIPILGNTNEILVFHYKYENIQYRYFSTCPNSQSYIETKALNITENRNGLIYHSNNGGKNWVQPNKYIRMNIFTEKRNNQALIKTIDRGKTWNVIEEDNLPINIKIYPNPASDYFFIDFGNLKNSKYTVVIRDIFGRNVFNIENKEKQLIKMDVGTFNKGLYIISIRTQNKETFIQKIIFI